MTPKRLKEYAIACLMSASIAMAGPPLQTPEKVGKWEELKGKGFFSWDVKRYSYRGQMADGGSLGFRFFTDGKDGNESFELIAANGMYLTDEDLATGLEQKFFIAVGNERSGVTSFEVKKGSTEEAELIQKLETILRSAAGVDSYDPSFLRLAITHIKTRKKLSDLFESDEFLNSKQKSNGVLSDPQE